MATAAQRNKVSRLLPRAGGAPLQLHWRGRGDPCRSQRLVSLPFYLKGWLPAFFCFKGAEMDVVWDLVVGRLDLALFFLDGGGCRSRAQIWESEVLGRNPGRWVIADGFILFFGTGVYFDSFSSQRAT